MRINPGDEIAGIPLVAIRSLFREIGLDGFASADFIGRRLGLNESQTERLIAGLRSLGLLKSISTREAGRLGQDVWALTDDGIRLRSAPAVKPIYRTTADRLLSELLQRIDQLNSDDRFLGRVRKAVVFGSYLAGNDRIGDLDVAVEIVPREPDFEKHREANNRRLAEEFAKGRRFANILEQAFWWQREAMLFLRNRKRGLSLQDYSSIKNIVDVSAHKVVFSDGSRRPQHRKRPAGKWHLES
jgi:hypothetical protein